MFSKDFSDLLEFCNSNHFGDDFIIGGGNPDSNILFVGQEPSDDAEKANTLKHYIDACGKYDLWTRNREMDRQWHRENPRFYTTGKNETKRRIESNFWSCHTTLWYNYQMLFDYIVFGKHRDHSQIFDFEENVFCSEINGDYSKRHADASIATMQQRKSEFFTHTFFDKFKVIVLACGPCIVNTPENPQISNTFKVIASMDDNPEFGARIRNNYWVHFDNITNPGKILIHTTNLSGPLKPDFIKNMGLRIHGMIKERLKINPTQLLVK